MEIIIGKNAGFCYGVQKAVEMTKEQLNFDKKIQCLGELVHNSRVVQELEKKGLQIIDNIEEAKGKTIIRAHGISKKIYEYAKEKNIELVDLTCPNVIKIHNIIEDFSKNGYFIFLIGSKNHPETIGSLGFAGENSFVLENEEDIECAIQKLINSNKNKILVIVQTTFSLDKFNNLVQSIKNNLNNYSKKDFELEIKNTICNATKIRQEEVEQISLDVDCMIIIGGKKSSNTKKLFDIAKSNCENTILIESINELDKDDINKFNKVGIMAGASTPREHIEEIKDFLEKSSNLLIYK